MSLHLRNPHSVLAAFQARPHDVLEIRRSPSGLSPGWSEVVEEAKRHGTPINTSFPSERRHEARPDEGRQGACEAVVRELPGRTLEEFFSTPVEPSSTSLTDNDRREGEAPAGPFEPGKPLITSGSAEASPSLFQQAATGLWLALDCLQDPQNVGAIFRTAAFFGVRGVIVTRDRSAPLSATVYDVASGGMELVPFAQPPNLARALDAAKAAGLWILGSSEHAEKSVIDVPHDRPWLLVLGSEEQGLRRLTLEKCDEVCRIPPRGALPSLNVSTAAAVLMAELSR